jgi:ADP-ribose pyrophosphatase YjhB (NUDIX family)
MIRIITGCIVVKGNKFAVIKERSKKYYGKVNLPLGHLDKGEGILKGAKRESEEETGLKLTLKGLVGIYQHKTNGDDVIMIIFNATTKSHKFNFPKDEILEADWITLEEYNKIPESDIRAIDVKTAINDFFKRGSISLDHVKSLI